VSALSPVEITARFRMPSRRAADIVAGVVRVDHPTAQVTVARTSRLRRSAGWTAYLRIPRSSPGLGQVEVLREGFAELAARHGGVVDVEARARRSP
jgi:hypothetical protein